MVEAKVYTRGRIPTTRHRFMRKIVSLKYKDGESIVEHINTLMGLVNQFAAAKSPFDDAMQALLMICTLSDN